MRGSPSLEISSPVLFRPLAACTQLMHLLISSNNFSGPFPPVIESFEHLEQLELSRNNFTGTIPEWVELLDGLWWFFIDDNQFSGPTPFLGDKPNLTHLNISNNPLNGNLEDILGFYPTLQYGNIDNTDITGELSPSHFNPDHVVSWRPEEINSTLLEIFLHGPTNQILSD